MKPAASLALAALMTMPVPGFAQPVRNPPAGKVLGTAEGQTAVFRGIPYARPPVGALRWIAPRSLARWHGIRSATRFGHICMQVPNPTDAGVGSESPSEDCLTLNIWGPLGVGSKPKPKPKPKRPVMLWLHGGGYTAGSGSAKLYDGRKLAEAGVVVVTINYRLGRPGFFAHPAFGSEVNFGLLDQIAALDWVRRNIGAFGGDPGNITLFGNSAGGESVLLLMTAAQARGKFARAIVQSGLGGRKLPGLRTPRGGLPSAQDQSLAFAAAHEAKDAAALRRLPAETLLSDPPSVYRGFGPILDGMLIREDPLTAFSLGHAAPVPLMIGYNSLEVPVAAVGGALRIAPFLRFSPEDRARWRSLYPSDVAFEKAILSDVLFRAPAIRIATEHASHGHSVYLYEFDIFSPDSPLIGAPHASERAFVFGNLAQAPWTTNRIDAEHSAWMVRSWTSFASGRTSLADMQWKVLESSAPKTTNIVREGIREGEVGGVDRSTRNLLPR